MTKNTYLLKKNLPNDPQNGADLRFINLCGFVNHVFYIFRKSRGESGKKLERCSLWESTQLQVLSEVAEYCANKNITWIAGDYESFLTLKALEVQSLVYDGSDSKSLYYRRRFSLLPWALLRKKVNAARLYMLMSWRERSISRYCAGVVVPAQEDACAFLRWGNSNVAVITNGTRWIEQSAIEIRRDSRTLLFHGAFSWPVNVSAAVYLVVELFPVVQERIKGVELRIAGNPVPDCLNNANQTQGITVEGYVEDLRQWLSQCGVYVMPMFQGGGVKNKLLEAMAAGLPIVTNSMGAEAMDDAARECFIVADGTEAIANAVVDLINNPARARVLGQRARQYAVDHFKWADLALRYRNFILQIAEMPSIKGTAC